MSGQSATSSTTGTSSDQSATGATSSDQSAAGTSASDQSATGATASDQNANQNASSTSDNAGGQLPQTASPLPFLGLLGMASFAAGAIRRWFR
jgi:cobalamin biosynthesis Mg chelatase CobN